MQLLPDQVQSFLTYVRERRLIQQRREAGEPFPWTDDPVLRDRKFCCVLRDDDRTSRLTHDLVDQLPETERLGAVLGFRLYNRPETLEVLHCRGVLTSGSGDAAQEVFAMPPPVINATAYKISVKGGLFNLKTIASMVALAARRAKTFEPRRRAELTCQVIRGQVGHGAFLAYQTMQDLRWLLGPFEDEDRWCILGLGATRGLARMLGKYQPEHWREKEKRGGRGDSYGLGFAPSEEDMLLSPPARDLMVGLLPPFLGLVGAGNLFEVEHNLCEWDKHCRATSGEAPGRSWRPKS